MNVQNIEIDLIDVAADHRSTSPAAVETLKDSIRSITLQHPIGLVEQQGRYRLIHGRRRLEAYRALEETRIPAIVHVMDDLQANLAEIDENLQRNELTAAEKSQALARRKEIWDTLYPETAVTDSKRMSAVRRDDKLSLRQPSFTKDAAAKTGQSQRTIQRAVKLGKNLDPQAAKTISATPVANNQQKLAQLSKLAPEDQRAAAKRIAAGNQSVLADSPPKADFDVNSARDRLRGQLRAVAGRWPTEHRKTLVAILREVAADVEQQLASDPVPNPSTTVAKVRTKVNIQAAAKPEPIGKHKAN